MQSNENDEELEFLAGHIVQRNSKVNLRIDPNTSSFNDINNHFEKVMKKRTLNEINTDHKHVSETISPDLENKSSVQTQSNKRRNSLEAALECMMTFDTVTDCASNHSSDVEAIDDLNCVQQRNGMRSKSVEDLLSVMKIDDEERFQFHNLDNFKQILNHESRHFALLNTIYKFKYILKESKVSDEVLFTIFYNIDDLIEAQKNLVTCLESMVVNWHLKKHMFTDIMDLYVLLHMRCKEYVKNIAQATRELKLLFDKNEKFFEAMNIVVYEGSSMRMEVLLSKPTNWLCNSLENIKCLIEAAEGDTNLKMAKETLEKLKDNSEYKKVSNNSTMEKNVFVRSGLFVELLPNDQRKLRHVFLFSAMLICAKQKLQTDSSIIGKQMVDKGESHQKLLELKHIEKLDAKWFIPLQNVIIHQAKDVENNDKRKVDISNLKDRIRELRMQLISEKAKISECDTQAIQNLKRLKSHNFSFRKMIVKKEVEKIQSQIMKAQTDLLLLSPTISFHFSNLNDKSHNLLVFSTKDLEIWKRDILETKKEIKSNDTPVNTLATVNNFLESYRGYSSIIEVANAPLLRNINEEGLSGVVVTTIESVDGLNPVYSYYLSIEVDSFNLNEVKARTKLCSNNSSLSWNESFDIDLDCSQTMNILLYQVKNFAHDKESLLGYFELKLDSKDLNNKTVTKTTSIVGEKSNTLQIQVSFKIKTKNDFMKRQPSMMKTSLFGISLNSIVSRERGKYNRSVENVPMIIQACLKIIEEKGINEEGIYRISGSKNDINEFYKRLNKNVTNALKDINNYDLHTITGIVKLYLRELPEPLMLTENYNRILEISNNINEEERNKQYTELIQSLPEPNHSTVVFILTHFQKVVEHSSKNQMIASNLGLIIGPTLMMPPCSNNKQDYASFAIETMNSMYLSRVFTQVLNNICSGSINLEPSKL